MVGIFFLDRAEEAPPATAAARGTPAILRFLLPGEPFVAPAGPRFARADLVPLVVTGLMLLVVVVVGIGATAAGAARREPEGSGEAGREASLEVDPCSSSSGASPRSRSSRCCRRGLAMGAVGSILNLLLRRQKSMKEGERLMPRRMR